MPTPDAWLERRLRVFERALNALEARADTTAREQARAIAQLQERLDSAANKSASASVSASVSAPVATTALVPLINPAEGRICRAVTPWLRYFLLASASGL